MQQSIPTLYLIVMASVILLDFSILPAGLLWQRKRRAMLPFFLGMLGFLLFTVLLEPLVFYPVSLGATWYISNTVTLTRSISVGLLELAGLVLAMKVAAPKNNQQALAIGWGWAGAEAAALALILLHNLFIWIQFNNIGPTALQSMIVQPFPWRSYPELAASWMTSDAGFSHVSLSGCGFERVLGLVQRVFCAGWLYNSRLLSKKRQLLCCSCIFALTTANYFLVEHIPFFGGTISYRLVSVFEMAGALFCALAAAGYYRTRFAVAVKKLDAKTIPTTGKSAVCS